MLYPPLSDLPTILGKFREESTQLLFDGDPIDPVRNLIRTGLSLGSSGFVVAAAALTTQHLQADQTHDADQYAAYVRALVQALGPPEPNQRGLNRVPSEIITGQDLTRGSEHPREVGFDDMTERTGMGVLGHTGCGLWARMDLWYL